MKRIFWMMVISAMFGMIATNGVSAEVTMETLLASSDIVLSPAAMGGAAVELVADPSTLRAGVKPPKDDKPLPPGQGGTPPGQGGTPPGGGGGGQTGGELIVNGGFTTDINGWTGVNAYAGVTSFGPITAPAGSADGVFAVVHTGGYMVMQGSLEQGLSVQQSRTATLSTVYNFVTTELGIVATSTIPNDNASITLTGPSGSITFQIVESILTSNFTAVEGLPNPPIRGLGNQNGGQTGWITATSGTLYLDRGNYNLRIEVNDDSDWAGDSALLIDAIGLQ